jgi:hypothetical protein
MDTNQICNTIKEFLDNLDNGSGCSGNPAETLGLYLERLGVEVSEPSASEKADWAFIVAVGDQAFFENHRDEVVAMDRLGQ